MAVRSSMANLIARVRVLTNDLLPSGSGQIFADQTVQDVMDETRQDIRYLALAAGPTYVGNLIQYLDYYSDLGGWEDDIQLVQYRTAVVTPATSENIVGHWTFTTTTLPPVYAVGKLYDVYRSAADLLERQASQWLLTYDFSSDGASFRRSQASVALMSLARTYRMKQRAVIVSMTRNDITGPGEMHDLNLDPRAIDYYGSGDGR